MAASTISTPTSPTAQLVQQLEQLMVSSNFPSTSSTSSISAYFSELQLAREWNGRVPALIERRCFEAEATLYTQCMHFDGSQPTIFTRLSTILYDHILRGVEAAISSSMLVAHQVDVQFAHSFFDSILPTVIDQACIGFFHLTDQQLAEKQVQPSPIQQAPSHTCTQPGVNRNDGGYSIQTKEILRFAMLSAPDKMLTSAEDELVASMCNLSKFQLQNHRAKGSASSNDQFMHEVQNKFGSANEQQDSCMSEAESIPASPAASTFAAASVPSLDHFDFQLDAINGLHLPTSSPDTYPALPHRPCNADDSFLDLEYSDSSSPLWSADDFIPLPLLPSPPFASTELYPDSRGDFPMLFHPVSL